MNSLTISRAIRRATGRSLSAWPGENALTVISRSFWVSGGSVSIGRIGNGAPLAGIPTDGYELNRSSSRAASDTDW